jgi:DNA polymerase-3 subunit alpha
MVDAYVNRKHKRETPNYPHPVMREILEETHGVMVYQEQVMRILNRLGGIELSQAYGCIKAISKKKAEVIAQGRAQFIAGATAQGLANEKATEIFELIEFFGGYGFNKSHSTAYALVAYQTAYLKAHYPTEFMAALLSSELDGAERDKLVEHIDECRRMGIEVLTPDINRGQADFRVASEGKIHFGLAAIRGVGVKAVEAIAVAREKGGPFTSLDDFFERVPIGIVNQACAETLIKAGAFDSLGARRSQLLAVLPRAVQAGQTIQEDRRRGQRSLFDAFGDDGDAAADATGLSLPDVEELPDNMLLAEEKKALGFYMSSHPLTRHAELLQTLSTHRVSDLAALADKAEVTLGGMIATVQVRNVQKSRSGLTRMAKLTFEDLTGSTPAMLWPEDFAKHEAVVKNDLICFVKGSLDRRRDIPEVVINKIIPIDRGPAELARGVVVRIRKGIQEETDLERVLRLLRQRPGNLDLYLELMGVGRVRRAVYKAGNGLRVRYDDRLMLDLEGVVGPGHVRLLGHKGATARAQSVAVAATADDEEALVEAMADGSDD